MTILTRTVLVLVVAGMINSCGSDSRVSESTVSATTKAAVSPAVPDSIPASLLGKTVQATKAELWNLVPKTLETRGGTVVVPEVYLDQIKNVLSNGTFTSAQLDFVVDMITSTVEDSEESLLYPIRSSNATSWRDFTLNYPKNWNVFQGSLSRLATSCSCTMAFSGSVIQVSQGGKVISTSPRGNESTGSEPAGWWGGSGEAVIDGPWFEQDQ